MDIIETIKILQQNGVTKEEMAIGFGVCTETIRNYAKGKIPAAKRARFLRYVNENYKEILNKNETERQLYL